MKERPTEFRTRKGQRVFRRRVYNRKFKTPQYAQNYTLRVRQDKKDSYFNLGTDKKIAAGTADEIAAFLSLDGNTVEEALIRYSTTHKAAKKREEKRNEETVRTKANTEVTVGMICKRYTEVTHNLSEATVRENIKGLRRIVSGIMDLPKLGKGRTKGVLEEWYRKTDGFPVSKLTKSNIDRFQQRELAEAKGDFEKLGSKATTMNQYVRSARSVFAEKVLHHYDDFNLPDPPPFRGIAKLSEPVHRYRSEINEANLMQSAIDELRDQEPEVWIVFLLAFGAGLRRKEIDKLMWEQVDIENRRIWIKTTRYFRPKARNSEYFVDVSAAVMKEIETYKNTMTGRDEDSIFVLPGRMVGGSQIRCRPIFRRIYAWLREHGITSTKPLHTLRKEAGSMLLEKEGSLLKVAEFLRNDIHTAREHYVGRKGRIEIELPGLG